jgi:hypothetical protein
MDDRVREHPHLVQGIAILQFQAPGPMDEMAVQRQQEIVEEMRREVPEEVRPAL